ncbi:F-box/kelch-repeat protein At1g67480-like [Musa acuminata AAA Group]|uniref:F-box/kelch-repeat protein At1g67480-like n=1 Tax=Musa acuminata AAA Group TaxID=214697 RepID=UPI0031DB4771
MPTLAVPGLLGFRRQFVDSEMQLNIPMQNSIATLQKVADGLITQMQMQMQMHPIIPGLPDDVAKTCLALVPRCDIPVMGAVCKTWRSFIQSKEFLTVRKDAKQVEEWLFILTGDAQGRESHWEVWGGSGEKLKVLLPMPGPAKAGFGVAVLDAKLIIVGGYVVDAGTKCVSNDVYQYDSRLNRWSLLAKMSVARHDFACDVVNGLIYAVGGLGPNGENLSSVEVYDPDKNQWTLIESLRRPRWGCFACSFDGLLYVMGGRSSFTIGNSRFVDVYSPQRHSWHGMKIGCVMVTTHAMLGKKLFCMGWRNQRKLSIFDPVENSWHDVPVPVSGSSAIGFCFGIFGGKLLLFSVKNEPGYHTLSYDPDAPVGSEWQISSFKPWGGVCLCSVTIEA